MQEEVGLRGARTSTPCKSRYCFCFRYWYSRRHSRNDTKEADSILGKAHRFDFDASMIPHKIIEFVIDVAEEMDIPFQYTVISGGGTDAGQMHLTRDGVPSVAITVPVRYLHSHTSVIHEDDYLNTVKLVTELVKRLDSETVEKFGVMNNE